VFSGLSQNPFNLAQLGFSLIVTVLIGTIFGPFGSGQLKSRFSSNNNNFGFYNKFYTRSHSFGKEDYDNKDILLLIDKFLEQFYK